MSKIPTEEQIRKWAEDEKRELLKEFSEREVRNEVNKLFQTMIFQKSIATSLGLQFGKWNGFEISQDFEKSLLYKEIKDKISPIIGNILNDVCKDSQLSKKDLQQIRSAYQKGFVETCKEIAQNLGQQEGEKMVMKILEDVMEKEG